MISQYLKIIHFYQIRQYIFFVLKNDIWHLQLGNDGYFKGDYTMNGTVDEQDKLMWEPNSGKGAHIPE